MKYKGRQENSHGVVDEDADITKDPGNSTHDQDGCVKSDSKDDQETKKAGKSPRKTKTSNRQSSKEKNARKAKHKSQRSERVDRKMRHLEENENSSEVNQRTVTTDGGSEKHEANRASVYEAAPFDALSAVMRKERAAAADIRNFESDQGVSKQELPATDTKVSVANYDYDVSEQDLNPSVEAPFEDWVLQEPQPEESNEAQENLDEDTNALQVSPAVDEHGDEPSPGAYSAPGRAFGAFPAWGRGQRSVSQYLRRLSTSQRMSSTRTPDVLEATLVQDNYTDTPTDMVCVEATPFSAEKPRDRKRHYILACLVALVIVVVVAVAVPLTVKNDDSDVPTVPTVITAVLQLDEKPSETSWSLQCGNRFPFKIPPGFYEGRENRLVTFRSKAGMGDDCELVVEDSGGDGIDNGFFELYYGGDIQDKFARIMQGSGNFTDIVKLSFSMDAPPTMTPTASPAPTVSLAPTFMSSVKITVVIKLDEFPIETGWLLTCNNETIVDTPAGTYSNAFWTVNQTLTVPEGSECACIISDLQDDGIFSEEFGEGYWKIFYGENTNNETNLLAEGGEFGSDVRIDFVALPPQPVKVTVKIMLDANPSEIGWGLTCGSFSRTVPIGTYNEPFQLVTEAMLVDNGGDCVFRIEDEGGNAMVGGVTYQVYLGVGAHDEAFLVADGGDFEFEEEIRFTASLSLVTASPKVGPAL